MLDARSKEVLKLIDSYCKEGSYQVIELEVITSSLPPKYKMDKEIILQILKHLSSADYISIKYRDDKVICVCPLPFGRQFIEAEEERKKNTKKMKNYAKGAFISALISALIGAFLGTLIYNIIF